jgi:hypothetical protein
MKIVKDALVTRDGAYYSSGGLIPGTQRFPTNHRMEYWQQGNLELNLAVKLNRKPNRVMETALYAGRIPLHFGHFLMEGLPRMCDSVEFSDIPMVGYYTEGFLPEGIEAMDIEDAKRIVEAFSSNGLSEIEDKEVVQVKQLILPELPLVLSQSCSEPWRMTEMISLIVKRALELYPNTKEIGYLYLTRLKEEAQHPEVIQNHPSDDIFLQIAKVVKANCLAGVIGSNTHLSMFASKRTKTEWMPRGDYEQAHRNQCICDLIRTYNKH